MVIDTLENARAYEHLHPRFKAAFDFLLRPDLASLPVGRLEIDGTHLFANVQEYETKSIQEGKLEAHRKYIDIQVLLRGQEFIGYAPFGNQPVAQAFDPAKDIGFYEGEAWFTLIRKGMFAIFFPQDAHLPGRHTDKPQAVKKLVLKIEVSA
jgi:YhcH/YjgK/YiaL family protein